MNKAEVVRIVARNVEMTSRDADKVITEFFNVVGDTVKKGEKVKLVGFGTFGARQRAARFGTNPQTGKEVEITACSIPTFRAGKHLKEKVKGGNNGEKHL